MKYRIFILAASALLLLTGCNSVYNLKMSPEKTDFQQNQTRRLESRHFRIPCRINIQCPETMVGIRDSLFFTDTYRYPLEMILDYTFKSIAFQVFDAPGNEVVDAFTLTVTVPESILDVAWGDGNYSLTAIIRFDDPREKRLIGFSMTRQITVPMPEEKDEVPACIYEACREIAFDAMKNIVKDPRVLKTIRRYEER